MAKPLSTWLFATLLLLSSNIWGQLAPRYSLNVSSGSFSSIASTGTAVAGVVGDDAAVNITGLSPGFTVNGVTYTSARMCSNGWLALYTTAPTSTQGYVSIANSNGNILSVGVTNAPVIFAPMNSDLIQSNIGTAAAYRQTIGTEHIFEWVNYSRYNGTAANRNDLLNFQIRLNTATSTVQFVYGACTVGTVPTATFQVGWKTNGATANNWATDINNLMIDVTGSPNTCSWADAVTGNANSSSMYLNNANPTVKPSSGLTYTWTPNAAPLPVRTFAAVSSITSSGATINFTAPTGATQYNVRYRAIGSCSWTNASGNPYTTTAIALTGLASSTTYQVEVQSATATLNAIYSHIPNQAGGGNGYVAAGTFTTLVAACSGSPAASTTISSSPSVCSGVNFTLSLGTSYTETGITYQWQSADDAAFTVGLTSLGTAATQVTSQTAAKYYRCLITCTNGGASIFSTALQVTMNLPTACYCTPTYTNLCSSGDVINSFSTTGGSTNITNNNSGCNGNANNYAYYSGQTLTATKGNTINHSIVCGTGFLVNQGFSIWIDYNLDGDFTDSGELVWSSANATNAAVPYTGSFTVPLTATAGTTRMRVRSLYNTIPTDPCINYGYGETEDYNVVLLAPANNDAGISAIPTSYCTGTQTVQATIKNFGLLTLNTATVNWTVNGVGQAPVNLSGLNLATGATAVVNLGTYNFLGATNYTIAAVTSLPNGAADGNTGNDAFTSSTFQTSMSGSYTVGAGGNFTTLTAAINSVNTFGVCAPTTLLLTDATYGAETYPIVINQFPGSSATNTLTIKPNTGVNAVLSGSSASAMIKLNGADYVTIDGSNSVGGTTRNLTITNTNTGTTSSVIWVASVAAPLNATTNNTIKNAILSGNSNTTTAAGIMASGSALGALAEIENNNNTYRNNQIFKTVDGIDLVGGPGFELNNIVADNEIGSTVAGNKIGWSGIFIAQQQNVVVSNNKVKGNTTTGTNITSGIEFAGTINGAQVFNNQISDIKNTNATGYGSAGILIGTSTTASNITIFNNFISDIASVGFNGFTEDDNGNGIAIYSGGGFNIYHNTVVLTTNQTLTGGNRAAAILVTTGVTTAGAIDLRNNVFANFQTVGNGNSRFAIASTANNNVYSNINYNAYFSTSGNLLCKGSNATIYTTLATLQANIGGNANSLAVNPLLVSTTDLHLQLSSTLDAAGTPITGITQDIDGDTRNVTTPDIGADEISAVYTWNGITSTAWNTPTNWTPNGIPNSCNATTIIPGAPTNQPVISTPVTVGKMEMQSLATLTVNADLSVCGKWTGVSNVVSGTAAVVFTNSQASDSLIGGATFSNLRIADNIYIPAGAANMVNIGNSLTLSSGTLTMNDNITLLSTVAGTAYLNDFTGTGIASGTLHVQRYNPLGATGYRQLGTPVAMPNIGGVTGFTVSGIPGFVIPDPSCNPNYVAYNSPYGSWVQLVENATQQYNCSQSLFEVLTSGGMTNGRGYYMDAAGGSTFTFNGAPNTGNVSFGLTWANGTVSNGWNMVSNPYPSPLSWELANVPAGMNAIAKIWVTSGAYLGTWQDLDPNTAGTHSVAIGQAFQVKVNTQNSTPSFAVDNSDRTTTPPNYLFAGGDPMTLNIDINGNGFADLTKVRFIDGATPGLDDNYDSPKMLGNANQPMVYSIWGGENYSTNSYGALDEVYALPLGVKIATSGQHTLSFSNVDQFPASALIYLEDVTNGTMQDLRVNDTYPFTQTAGDIQNRFILHFYPPVEKSVTDATCETAGEVTLTEESPSTWAYTMKNAQNVTVSQGILDVSQTVTGLAAGDYTLTLTHQTSGYVAVETVSITGMQQVDATAQVSVATVEAGQEVQFTANTQNATAWDWNFGDGNTSSEQNPVHIYNAAGNYTATLVASNGNCDQSAQVSVSAYSTVSIEDNMENAGVKMWNDNYVVYLNFQEEWIGKTIFTLYDMSGKKVFQQTISKANGSQSIDCGILAAGTYTAEIKNNSKTASRKVVMGTK